MQSVTSPSRVPKQGRSRLSFERIIEATIDLLHERPYEQITLAAICERADVSTGSLYGRVGGKDELLRVVQIRFLARLDAQFDDEMARIEAQCHGLARVVPAVVSSMGNLLKKNANVLRAFMLRGPYDDALHAVGSKSADDNHAKAVRLLRACKDEILHPDMDRAIETSMLLINAGQARFLGLDSVGGRGNDSEWKVLLEDLSDVMLAYLRFVPQRRQVGVPSQTAP
jgi:AcrR family transcriptional regulator